MIVAEIMNDRINDPDDAHIGRKFDYESMQHWWGWPDSVHAALAPKVLFKLYDDDGELYYEGWLLNDDECIVQQFVLRWAESDSGCTTIKVEKGGKFIQEIG